MARKSKGHTARRLQSRKRVAAGKLKAKRRVKEEMCNCKRNCKCD